MQWSVCVRRLVRTKWKMRGGGRNCVLETILWYKIDGCCSSWIHIFSCLLFHFRPIEQFNLIIKYIFSILQSIYLKLFNMRVSMQFNYKIIWMCHFSGRHLCNRVILCWAKGASKLFTKNKMILYSCLLHWLTVTFMFVFRSDCMTFTTLPVQYSLLPFIVLVALFSFFLIIPMAGWL